MTNLPMNSLTDEDKKTPVASATIEQFAKIFERFEEFEARIKMFFGENAYFSIVASENVYHHNLLQFCMAEFFENEGFEKVFEAPSEWSDNEQPMISEAYCDLNKKFKVYLDAIIFFANEKTGSRFCVEMDTDPNSGITSYRYFYDDKSLYLKEAWTKYAKEHNFYRGKKIDATCQFLDVKSISWDDVILSDKIRNVIKKNVENLFKYRKILNKNKLDIKRGTIISGPPGCVVAGTKIKIRKKKEEGKHNIVDNTMV